MSVEEYLRVEEASPERHEYVAGEAFAMVGVTARHHWICSRIFGALLRASGDGPCQPYMADMRLRTLDDRVYYPDVMVTGSAVAPDATEIRDPCLIVEVVSRRTRRTDRVEKADAYRRLSSLRSYLIVEQRVRHAERYWRDDAGAWQHEVVTDAGGGSIRLSCPDTILTLDEIYRNVPLGDDAQDPADG
jgi:Uma2 family endonuclease